MRKYGLIGLFALMTAAFGLLMSGNDEIVYQDGNYGVIEISGGKKVKFDGIVNVQNINVNGPGTITVTFGSTLNLSGSLHQNGSLNIYNYGKINAGNYEAQNGNNYFLNEGEFTANIGQITDCSSIIENKGEMTFTSFQANCGIIKTHDCSSFKAGHLDINGKVFSGTGFVAALNSINVNNVVAPPGLFFYSPREIDNRFIQGIILVSKDWECTPLAIAWSYLDFTGNTLSFEADSPGDIDHVLIEVSKDGRHWLTAKKVTDLSKINNVEL